MFSGLPDLTEAIFILAMSVDLRQPLYDRLVMKLKSPPEMAVNVAA
jgi:hypothetical protein